MYTPRPYTTSARGMTLIELIVFIVVVSIGLAGVLTVMNQVTKSSADPVMNKQALAIAESLLNEIEQQPFTYCDPDDANAATATSTAGCTGGAAGSQDKGGGALSGPTPGTETRYASAATPFDNVADYGGYSKSDIDDISGANAMSGYTASVAISRDGTTFSLPNDAVLKIAVTVTKGSYSVSLTGYRFRYAPNI